MPLQYRLAHQDKNDDKVELHGNSTSVARRRGCCANFTVATPAQQLHSNEHSNENGASHNIWGQADL